MPVNDPLTFIPPRNIDGPVGQAFLALSKFLTRIATPIGAVSPFAGATVPNGWLLCDGRSLSRTTYRTLFDVIGTTWGASDSSTFRIPDLRGRVILGAGTGTGLTNRVLAAAGGTETHVLSESEIPSHNHSLSITKFTFDANHYHAGAAGGGLAEASNPNGGAASPTPVTDNRGGGSGHNNMQPWAALNCIIRSG